MLKDESDAEKRQLTLFVKCLGGDLEYPIAPKTVKKDPIEPSVTTTQVFHEGAGF